MEPHVHVKAERELLPEEPLVAFQQLPVALLAASPARRAPPRVCGRRGTLPRSASPATRARPLHRPRLAAPVPAPSLHRRPARETLDRPPDTLPRPRWCIHLSSAARRPSPRANLFGGGALVASRLPLHALANSTRWAPTPKIRALKLTVGRFVISVMYAAVLYLFTARHPHAPPSQVVAGPPHRRVVKRHTAG